MKPKIWKDEHWYISYQLNHWGINDKILKSLPFISWNAAMAWLNEFHKVIQWPTKPSAS